MIDLNLKLTNKAKDHLVADLAAFIVYDLPFSTICETKCGRRFNVGVYPNDCGEIDYFFADCLGEKEFSWMTNGYLGKADILEMIKDYIDMIERAIEAHKDDYVYVF